MSSRHGPSDHNGSSTRQCSGADLTEDGLLGKRGRDDRGEQDNVSPPTKAKRSSRHQMSEEARQKKNERWKKLASERRKKHEQVVQLDKHPCDFIRFPTDNVKVRQTLCHKAAQDDTKDVLLTCLPPSEEEEEEQKALESLCRLTDEKTMTLKPQTVADLKKISLSSNILIRICKVVKLTHLDIILQQYKKLINMGFVPYEDNKNRSNTPALHAGVWRRYSCTPAIVSEVWQERAAPEKRQALSTLIRDICAYFKLHILPRVLRKVQQYYPDFFKLHIADEIGKIDGIAKYPEFNLGGPFSTFAIKIVDHFDAKLFLAPAVVLPGGKFSGADLKIPQLRGRMPIEPGMLVAGNMRTLAHGSSKHTGKRLGITLFLDNPLLITALQNATHIV
ncbi:hypothetical protein GGX14DRAFT_561962 [Mycena pura]|uniref:Uncharacterized protein n=1 Tax=Mycena pura TaxID=153505 RepID=A0AAD6VL87_9AGAR|nr:hypothetical protein GGX14DRAFT_561962 [Mycena pura]